MWFSSRCSRPGAPTGSPQDQLIAARGAIRQKAEGKCKCRGDGSESAIARGKIPTKFADESQVLPPFSHWDTQDQTRHRKGSIQMKSALSAELEGMCLCKGKVRAQAARAAMVKEGLLL